MSKPKISVIVSIYNSEKYLFPALHSLLSSTYKNLEIILVDNGSTDSSRKICDFFALDDPRIFILHIENPGVCAARNAGLDIASGEWIGFMDSDDKIDPDMYEYLLQSAIECDADIAQCAVYKEYEGKTEIVNSPIDIISADCETDMDKVFWEHFALSVWSKIYKKQFLGNLRFNPEYIIGEDLRFNLEALIKSQKTILLPCPKYHYFQRHGSVCNSIPTEKNLTAFGDMLKDAEKDFTESENITNFIFSERMRNNGHICSKILLSSEKRFKNVICAVKKDIKNNIFHLWKADSISAKDKLKLSLIAYGFPVYKTILKTIKKLKSENNLYG